jgi:hypothetical protein
MEWNWPVRPPTTGFPVVGWAPLDSLGHVFMLDTDPDSSTGFAGTPFDTHVWYDP